MREDNKSSLEHCLAFTIVVSFVTVEGLAIIFVPMIAIVVLVCAVSIGVIYLCFRRLLKPRTEGGDTSQEASPAVSGSSRQPEEAPASTEAISSALTTMATDGRHPSSSAESSPSLEAPRIPTQKQQDSVENLQARIKELEERVRFLRECLAGGPTTDTSKGAKMVAESKSSEGLANERGEELSERALQQLLEALDEKLAKGAISQQLYQRLRTKYLARLSKAQDKREAASQAASSKPRRRR
jgi:hypothetical protein